ncbi:MAG: NYN domain-containing protein [Kiritimatiellia bacterium]
MAIRAMIFIDGCWLYKGRQALFDKLDESGFEIDYKRIPDIIAQSLAEISGQEVDIVRTCYYGTIPANKLGYNPAKQQLFYDFLGEQCGYEMDITEIDFRKEPTALPDNKWINSNLSSAMTYYATLPGAYDVAVLVGGDADYAPVLRRVRSLGKRIQLVAMNVIRNHAISSKTLLSAPGCFDFPHIYMDEHALEFRLQRDMQKRVCMNCGKEEETTWAGEEFYCTECRAKRSKRVRTCGNCGKEEETTWDKDFFYCSECRAKYRASDPYRPSAEQPPEDNDGSENVPPPSDEA